MNNIQFISMYVLLGVVALGCNDDDPDNTENEDTGVCTPEVCEPQCAATVWKDLDESFWIFEATCADDSTCQCSHRCDPERCTAYCQEELEMAGGVCFLSCDCFEADGGRS